MTPSHPYTFVLLRYRHDPIAGEFVNVGVLMHSPKFGFLDARIRKRAGRLSKVFPDLDRGALGSSLRSLERATKRLAKRQADDLLAPTKDAAGFARVVLQDDDSCFLWGPLGSGLTDEPRDTLERLFARFVTQYDEKHRPHRDDAAVWKPVHDRLAERKLDHFLTKKTIRSEIDKVDFDHAWKNGEWHCYQPLSFDLANEENIREKAARWAGHILALKDSEEPFQPYFLVGSPTDSSLERAYRSAIKILELNQTPRIFDESKIDDFVDQIEDEISRSRSRR